MFANQKLNNKYQIIKPTPTPKTNEKETKMEEEINTDIYHTPKKETKQIKNNIEQDKINNNNIELKEEEEAILQPISNINEENPLNIKLNHEKEIIKVEIGKNIFVRIIQTEKKFYIDFCKFYKGYPTKKNIKIEYETYIKLHDIITEEMKLKHN